MSIGRRRPKLSRVQLRPAESISLKETRVARQRARLALLLLRGCRGGGDRDDRTRSGPPFTFRMGERPARELRVNVSEFKLRNQTKTSNERQAAADQVAPEMVNDPGPIRELAEKLDDLTTAVARSTRFEDLRESLRSSWKLKPESYLDLKAATDTPERRDNLHAKLAAAFEPLLRDGVLGPGTLPVNEESSRVLSVRNVGEPRSAGQAGAARPRGSRTNHQARRRGRPGIQGGLHDAAGRPDPLRPGRRQTRLAGDAHLRGRSDGPASRRGAQPRSATFTTLTSRGDVLVEAGQTIGEEQLILLRLEHEAAMDELSFGDRARRGLGILALVAGALLPGGSLRLPARAAIRRRLIAASP